MLRFAAELAAPFSREQEDAHFTASAAVLEPARALVCLVDHVKLGRRLQPGGHVEPDDEGPAQAALREVREETGLVCELERELAPGRYRDGDGRPKLVRFWLMRPRSGRFRPNSEVDELSWLSLERALATLSYEHDRALVRSVSNERPSS